MSIKYSLPLLSLFCLSANVSAAEEFHHQYVQLNHAKKQWKLDTQHAFNENVYGTAFIDRSEEVFESQNTLIADMSVEAITLGAGLFAAHKVGNNMQIYGGVELNYNNVSTSVKNYSETDDSFISYRPKVGVSFARQGGIELDINAAYNKADFEFDFDHVDNNAIYDTLIMQFGIRYHVIPSLTISSTYDMPLSDGDILDVSNVMLSVRLNFQ